MKKLAIYGGQPSCPQTLPSWPHYDDDEIEAVTALLRSGRVNQWTGDSVRQFEKDCQDVFGSPYAVAVANGTLALELALLAAGVGSGDEVIVTSRSFIASVSCVIQRNATPVFSDVDKRSQLMTPQTIEAVISSKTKAIIPVHLNGWPCDMPNIMALAKKHDLYVIEDCAQAHGSKINGQSVGSYGHAAAFSFCQDKIISTGGEGGMVLFQSDKDFYRAWAFKDHGKSYDTVFNTEHPPGFRWLHTSFGTNWRMTSIQAIIGCKQLKKLTLWHQRRTQIAKTFLDFFENFDCISIPLPNHNMEHAWYRFSFHVDENQLASGWHFKKLIAAIQAEGISCIEVCPEIYQEKAFDQSHMPKPICPNAVILGKEVLQLSIHPMMDEQSLNCICRGLKKVLNAAI